MSFKMAWFFPWVFAICYREATRLLDLGSLSEVETMKASNASDTQLILSKILDK